MQIVIKLQMNCQQIGKISNKTFESLTQEISTKSCCNIMYHKIFFKTQLIYIVNYSWIGSPALTILQMKMCRSIPKWTGNKQGKYTVFIKTGLHVVYEIDVLFWIRKLKIKFNDILIVKFGNVITLFYKINSSCRVNIFWFFA